MIQTTEYSCAGEVGVVRVVSVGTVMPGVIQI